jgi:hypothetical protein
VHQLESKVSVDKLNLDRDTTLKLKTANGKPKTLTISEDYSNMEQWLRRPSDIWVWRPRGERRPQWREKEESDFF